MNNSNLSLQPKAKKEEPKRKRKNFKASNSKKRARGSLKPVGVDNDGNTYYEAEAVVGRRVVGLDKRIEWKVKWSGYNEMSWEPDAYLCDTLHNMAREFCARSTEKRLGIHDGSGSNQSKKLASAEAKKPKNNDKDDKKQLKKPPRPLSKHSNKSKRKDGGVAVAAGVRKGNLPALEYQEIERISVTDPEAKMKVSVARQSGIPVCLVGHSGWAQFAKPWIKKLDKQQRQHDPFLKQQPHPDPQPDDDSPLDLSAIDDHRQLDVDCMKEMVGEEEVPISKRHYDESKPITEHIRLSRFLDTSWPEQKTANKLYLHQWQFPLSQTASPIMCDDPTSTDNDDHHHHRRHCPIPNQILGEDLLNLWLDSGFSPFQYLFMGSPNTMSKLHRDNGGLMISIAPIVGMKEVTLVHRADGSDFLYNLEVNLERPDVDCYPMMKFARMWKSVIVPGEILIMPNSTYHQCRNVTPCLSYSRFHLDEINLPAFISSLMDKDTADVEHEETLWNAMLKLVQRVDKFTDAVKQQPDRNHVEVPENILSAVKSLGALRSVARELERRQKSSTSYDLNRNYDWYKIVTDVDGTLFDFKHRTMEEPPKFHRERAFVDFSQPKNVVAATAGPAAGHGKADDDVLAVLRRGRHKSNKDKAFLEAPVLDPFRVGLTISDAVPLESGDNIGLQLCGRFFKGSIVSIIDYLEAAFVEMVEFPPNHNDFVPMRNLRVKPPGESDRLVLPHELRVGMFVNVIDKGQPYKGKIKRWRTGTFYKVQVSLTDSLSITRLICRDDIIERDETPATNEATYTPYDRSPVAKAPRKMSTGQSGDDTDSAYRGELSSSKPRPYWLPDDSEMKPFTDAQCSEDRPRDFMTI